MSTPLPRRALTALNDHGPAVPATLIPLTNLEALRQAGIVYPESVDSWRWLYRHRRERGLEHVFKRIGKRILVDIPAYLEAVRALGI